MPQQSLTEEQRAEALRKLAFPSKNLTEDRRNFEQQYGPLRDDEFDAILSKRYATLGLSKVLVAPTDIGEKEALKLCGQPLDDRHYDLLLSETGMVVAPDLLIKDKGLEVTAEDEPVCILLKNVIPQDLLDAVRPVVRKAASQRKVAGGNRGVAAGTGMVQRRNRKGQTSNVKGTPYLEDLSAEDFARLRSATDGTLGYLARDVRPGGQIYPCRLTHYSGALPRELALMGVLAKAVAETFKLSWMSDRWAVQFEKASQTALTWLIRTSEGHTPFTTITCNRSFRTAAHVDKGDLKEGFGVMCCLGGFEGCDLVFPRYRTAVRYREGDVLLADVHQVHGNTPLLNPDGNVPEVGREPERLVCVFYYQEHMDKCERTVGKEHEVINRRERGDWKAKAKADGKK
jgi:hypothetical protein